MALSPMMKHWFEVKEKHPDEILFYRLGDFYEMFNDDAVVCSRVLELTLTGKECGLEKRAPMCGIPYHAADSYIAKLIDAGYRVAICEQLSDPKTTKGLVQRDVIRVITPGTTIEDLVLKADKNNFLCSVYAEKQKIGVCYADISTGLMEFCEFTGPDSIKLLDDTLARVKPSEVICNTQALHLSPKLASVKIGAIPNFYLFKDNEFSFSKCEKLIKKQFNVSSL